MQPNPYLSGPDNTNTPQPTPSIPPQITPPSTQRVIQPISSEEEIRAAQVANDPSPTTEASQESSTLNPTNGPMQSDETSGDSYYAQSTLVTEPIQHVQIQPGVPQNHIPAVSPVATPIKKKHHVVLSIGLVFGVGLVTAAYVLFGLGRVGVHDLVETTVQNTTYLHPKQWKELGLGVSSYGDMLGKNDKSNALVSVNVSPTANTALVGATDDTYQQLRTSVLSLTTAATISPAFKNGDAACLSDVDLQKEADMSSTPTTVGIYKVTATCHRSADGGTYIMKMRAVAGRDGRMRMIAVIAAQASWKRNGSAYDKIVDSLQQSDPRT